VVGLSLIFNYRALADKRTWHSRELIYHRGINVILFVPILAQDEVIGVIVIDATGERKTFTEEEIYFCCFEQFGRRNFRKRFNS